MGTGGKSKIKKAENTTNRQVTATYSKRRNTIFKKAKELTEICDARVSIVIVSNTGKVHEYISPHTATKDVYDDYQKTLDIDVWTPLHDKMQEELRELKEVNNSLKREIAQRCGEQLEDLGFEDLVHLGDQVTDALDIVTNRKLIIDKISVSSSQYNVMTTKASSNSKKVNNMMNEEEKLRLRVIQEHVKNVMDGGRKILLQESICEDPQFGMVESEADCEKSSSI